MVQVAVIGTTQGVQSQNQIGKKTPDPDHRQFSRVCVEWTFGAVGLDPVENQHLVTYSSRQILSAGAPRASIPKVAGTGVW